MKSKIFKSISLFVVISLLVSYLLISVVIYRQFYDDMKSEVKKETTYLKKTLDVIGQNEVDQLQVDNNRVTIINPDGTVVYDSSKDVSTMENHKSRPEIQDAIVNGHGEITRYSDTLGKQTYYYAIRLDNGNILRVANTTDSVFTTLRNCLPLMVVIGIIVLLITMLVAKVQTKKIITPINNLDLDNPLENDVYEELTPLLHRIDEQNEQIKKQISKLHERQEEFFTITSNMKESLIIINPKALILSINKAAETLFLVEGKDCVSKHILTLSRNKELHRVVESALGGNSADGVLDLNNRYLRILASPVIVNDIIKGAVLIIIDITDKQNAENMRKEFSANVSHELKTPLMSISGYAEIMKNGLVKSEDIEKFSERIYKEARRLSTLVEDIIKLSILDETNAIELEKVDLFDMTNEIILRLEPQTKMKAITVKLSGESVIIDGVSHIIDELIFNLVDNAIKYSNVNGNILINIFKKNGKKCLSVKDYGIGIPKDDVDRIFERFYRVDKSHSRETGGTGLGLSIVKHAAIIHDARITVNSELGKGSEFIVEF